MKRLLIATTLVMKIQNLIVNYKSRSAKWNTEKVEFLMELEWY